MDGSLVLVEYRAPYGANNDYTAYVKRESESRQFMNTSQGPIEEADRFAGYEERIVGFDLNRYIEKVNFEQFKCNICGYVSSKKDHVRMHVENKHFPGLVEYSCDQCEKNFNTMTKYRNHRNYHHSNKK